MILHTYCPNCHKHTIEDDTSCTDHCRLNFQVGICPWCNEAIMRVNQPFHLAGLFFFRTKYSRFNLTLARQLGIYMEITKDFTDWSSTNAN